MSFIVVGMLMALPPWGVFGVVNRVAGIVGLCVQFIGLGILVGVGFSQ